ncbi:hypothetical protein SAMD00019534_043050 [Acytostelium subglobosum LB1]|uniref:hypothetical protein n=1 Tax=Acytostelium subglobosum LB1 TaxID=1410327 RepID=UPI000645213B|nr:hypothetical protein SAMD00019534_043050 [Acytostelium subglobosum LB1]GAM21130.1 hypothetical protein SAMD00019534_043050 [Acytostelium subglobosum LB1]|eukprot:XP_012756264.1 hypothetical protein SAMD00019534_043050 [Acytostelium subglobosum LB1]
MIISTQLATKLLVALMLISAVANVDAYLPGMFSKDYKKDDEVLLKVNKITSVHTQLPFTYYKLPVCRPAKIQDESENLGEILLGDRIESSLYEISFLNEVNCKVLNSIEGAVCTDDLDQGQLKDLSDKIQNEYKVHWILDGLPVRLSGGSPHEPGFPLGYIGTVDEELGKNYVYNHANITILYHKNGEDEFRVVGFEVTPISIAYNPDTYRKDQSECPEVRSAAYGQTVTSAKETIYWTYSVTFKQSDVRWEKRWDSLLSTDVQSRRFHWFSILNSLIIVFFLTIMVGMILMRTLKADFRRYNTIDASEEAEETGWKMIHGDVFRPPSRPMLLSVMIGSGVQLFSMAGVTMLFAFLGFLSPANIGSLATALVVLFIIMAMFAGYFSTRNYMIFKGQNWKRNTIYTAFGFPGIIFTIFFIINMFLRGAGSSAAVPFPTFLSLIAMWFGISVPLVFCGSYYASKKPVPQDPVRTNQIPRQIPDQIWYMKPTLSILMGGILPFGAVFIELYFILSALWDNQFYYIFGFLFIVLVILIVTSAEITIVMCYFQLCAEDYHWWWRSFLTSGASAFFMFLYTIFFFRRLQITKFVSVLLYFGYSLIMSLSFFVVTGAIGYYSCYFFVRKIYSSIHIN